MPPDAHALLERLRRDFDRFSPAQQALARYLADHIAELPLLSAHEIARAAHCSPATVVRFAQSLGYSGYPHLQTTVRQSQRPSAVTSGVPARGDEIGRAIADERGGLDDARTRLQSRGLGPVVAALRDRSPLILAGEGHARPVIALLEERLTRNGRAVAVLGSLDGPERAWLDSLPSRAGMIAVGVGRENRVAEAASAAALAAGLPVAALIDSTLSTLARIPLARIVPAEIKGDAPSLVPMVAVAQALATGLTRRQAPAQLAAVGA